MLVSITVAVVRDAAIKRQYARRSTVLETSLDVSFFEIFAFEEQLGAHGFGEGVHGAIAEIESGLRIDALAVASKRLESQGGEMDIVRNDFRLDQSQEILEVVQSVDATSGVKNVTGFLIGDGADESTIGADYGFVKGCALRIVIENGDEG